MQMNLWSGLDRLPGRTKIGLTLGFDLIALSIALWASYALRYGRWTPPTTLEQFGLLLQKLTATANFAASGAELFDGHLSAEHLDRLAFDISGFRGMAFGTANGYCGAGAPRFNVGSSAAATCFLGCAHGQKTQDPQSGWWTISFRPPYTQYPGCEGGVTGTVDSIEIVFDEGTDVGPGSVVIDDVRVNNRVIGKPLGNDHH